MVVSQLPDFEHALALAGGGLDTAELSECHGVACGLICRQPAPRAADYLRLLSMLALVQEPGDELCRVLEGLHQATVQQFEDHQFRMALWLPADEEPLEERTRALAGWCTGFLAGLGGGEGLPETLSAEAAEALEDLGQIANAEVVGEGDPDEEEGAYAEIVEYIRVAVLLLREDWRAPALGDRIH